MARKFHPDVAKDKTKAEGKVREINEANEVFSDPDKRLKYMMNWELTGTSLKGRQRSRKADLTEVPERLRNLISMGRVSAHFSSSSSAAMVAHPTVLSISAERVNVGWEARQSNNTAMTSRATSW